MISLSDVVIELICTITFKAVYMTTMAVYMTNVVRIEDTIKTATNTSILNTGFSHSRMM